MANAVCARLCLIASDFAAAAGAAGFIEVENVAWHDANVFPRSR